MSRVISQAGQYLNNVMNHHVKKPRYLDKKSLEVFQEEAKRIIEQYPDRIPVIVEPSHDCRLPEMDKKKFLVPYDMTLGQFVYVIRKRIRLSSEMAMFLFIGDELPNTNALMSQLYNTMAHPSGFLFIEYSGENVFGLDD